MQDSEFQNSNSRYKFIISAAILIVALVTSSLIFSGAIDKIAIKISFSKAFFYRMVGNCDLFIKYIEGNEEGWLKKCGDEKNRSGGAIPVKDFKVLRIDYSRQEGIAFLQAELARDNKLSVHNYELVKTKDGWKISGERD